MRFLDPGDAVRLLDRIFATYCDKCGARCVRVYVEGFDIQTGKQNWIYACPTRYDGHWGMNDCRYNPIDKVKP